MRVVKLTLRGSAPLPAALPAAGAPAPPDLPACEPPAPAPDPAADPARGARIPAAGTDSCVDPASLATLPPTLGRPASLAAALVEGRGDFPQPLSIASR